jgi:hypothetical protein
MANSNGWGDGAANNAIGWGQGANNAIGWGDIHADSYAGLTDIVGITTDPDAQAFITAAAITDPTQQAAINTLVVDLKGYSIWSKMKALYPFVGDTASTHKFNLKNPLDTNAAFRLSFLGGWTHSVNGALPNGTNGYADTFLNDLSNLSQNDAHCSVYSRTNTSVFAPAIGSNSYGQNGGCKLTLNVIGGTYYSIHSADQPNTANTDTRGFFIGNRTLSTSTSLMIRGSVTTHTQASQTPSNTTFKIGGIPSFYDNKQIAFASIGDGLTAQNMTDLNTAVQAFQTTLGRSIGTQTVSDADAQAFVTAAAIDDQVEATAINNLVIGMKADGLWTKMKAVYPFVGGTASAHKFNLKNPLDTDAAFRLTFTGGWTHTSTGAKPNGVNASADTYYNAFSLMGTNQQIGYYIGENLAGNFIDIGSNAGTDMGLWTRRTTDQFRFDFPQATVPAVFTNTDSRGNYLVFNNSTLGRGVYKNGVSIYSSAFQNVNIFDNDTRKIVLSKNVYTFFSPRELRLVALGTGFTSLTEVTNYTNAVQAFQTALNRNI